MEKFTAVFEQDGDWWIGYVEELPGAHTQGRTLDEARDNLKEAVQMILDAKGPNSKAVVWAHNSHIGDARQTDMGRVRDELNIGQLYRERFGDERS